MERNRVYKSLEKKNHRFLLKTKERFSKGNVNTSRKSSLLQKCPCLKMCVHYTRRYDSHRWQDVARPRASSVSSESLQQVLQTRGLQPGADLPLSLPPLLHLWRGLCREPQVYTNTLFSPTFNGVIMYFQDDTRTLKCEKQNHVSSSTFSLYPLSCCVNLHKRFVFSILLHIPTTTIKENTHYS